MIAQDGGDRDVTAPLAALRGDLALDGIPAASYVDNARCEVDVVPKQADELAPPQAGIERRRPQRTVGGLERLKPGSGLDGRATMRTLQRTAGFSIRSVGLIVTSPRATARR